MKTLKVLSLVCISLLFSCNKPIALDDPKVEGTGPGALAVIEKAEAALAGISSISAVIESIKDSDMYGHEKTYEGTLKAEFGGKPGTLGNRWFEAKQSAKGRDKHIRGVFTKDGLKELHLLKNKVVKGDESSSSGAWISGAFGRAYGDETFYSVLKDYRNRPEMPSFDGVKRPVQKQNVYLEAIETIHGKECYVIRAYNPAMPDRVISRYYFGVKDGYYYGESTEVNTEDGNQISKTLIKEFTINEELPTFDVEVPEDFAVEMYTAPWDAKSMGVGMQAHDWTLPNQEGSEQTLSKEYAENVVLLDFWATWCGPCKAKMPFIQKMHEKYKDKGLKIISVLSGDVGHEKQAAEYIKKHKYTFDLVFGNNELSSKYKIRFLPTVMMVDDTGNIIYFRDTLGVNDGIDEKVELEDAIKNALNIT